MTERPADTLKLGGKTITMSYGVLNDLTRIGIDITQLGLMIVDPGVRDAVLSMTLSPRNDDGDFDTPDGDPLPVSKLGLSVDDAMEVLEWVVDHVAYFFMRSIEQASRLREKYAERASSLMSSSTGSETSPSKSPFAGPSDAPLPNSDASDGNSPSTT